MKRLPIGISDFKKLIEYDYYFVDTSEMIADIYREPADISLITRPRRFGKTLNMSMLRYFFDNRLDSSELFKDLKIAEDTEVMKEMNGYPTLFLTFKDIKDNCWKSAESQLINLISRLYDDHYGIIEGILKSDIERQSYDSVRNKTASLVDYKPALQNLTEYLFRVYSKPVILLIDEYDVPIQSGWNNGYYDEIIDFMRGFLSGALKDNSYLFKGVLTGIYRVAKESIFSGLNNLKVYTVLKKKYAEYFGFTEGEIEKIFHDMDETHDMDLKDTLKSWYNGYNFGGLTIYNPWSVINYLYDRELQPYWINTSSNDLIRETIDKNMKDKAKFREEIEQLISGKCIKKRIDDASSLRELNTKPGAIWALFLFSGYLKPYTQRLVNAKYECELEIPNREVLVFFQDTVIEWLSQTNSDIIYDMADSLTAGNSETFCNEFKEFVSGALSYHDIKGEPENTYHMILLGMFAHLSGGYWIKSNRESGLGRYDILLKAKDKQNYSAVIEIKSDPKALKEAMKQINDKAYIQALKSEGYTKILKVALGVDGKTIETMVEVEL